MGLEVRIHQKRCLCWLDHGLHQLHHERSTHRLVCNHCGGDGVDAIAAGEEYEQAWSEYRTEEWLRDEQERGDRPSRSPALMIPRRLLQALRGGS